MVWFSALDLNRVLDRALRRTVLPLYFTQGFSPHVKLSFDTALKVGVAGQITVTFYFIEPISAECLRRELVPQLPAGLEIIDPITPEVAA